MAETGVEEQVLAMERLRRKGYPINLFPIHHAQTSHSTKAVPSLDKNRLRLPFRYLSLEHQPGCEDFVQNNFPLR